MRSHITLFLVCLLAICGSGLSPRYQRRVVIDGRDGPPHSWKKRSKTNAGDILPVRIALRQSNLHKAEVFIMDVASPGSPNFAKHWSAKQVAETFAPSQESIDAVRAWLCDADPSLSPDRILLSSSRGWLTFNATVTQAENLLETTYHIYQHNETGVQQIASESYSVPEAISKHVDFITPTLHFDSRVVGSRKRNPVPENNFKSMFMSRASPFQKANRQRKRRASAGEIPPPLADESSILPSLDKPQPLAKIGSKVDSKVPAGDLSNCDSTITPDCVRALYGIPTKPITAANNSLGISEFSPNTYLESDLDLFFANYSSNLVGTSPTFNSIDGGIYSNGSGQYIEANLDLQYAMTLTQPLKLVVYEVGDLVEYASFNNFLDAIDGSYCTYDGGDDPNFDPVYPDPSTNSGSYTGPKDCGTYTSTHVISTSYSSSEFVFTAAYVNRQCYEYMKLGLLGVTVLFSSGDFGVATEDGFCHDNHGITDVFAPNFPSTCPYVTSVGGTQINPGATVTQPEVAVSSVVYSGGGFSNFFPIPAWQEETLAKWWATYPPPYSFQQFNNSQKTRGYPDISANAANYIIALDGEFQLVYGTSASCPVVASLITHINDELLNAGKKPVGFINPVLYAHPEVLNDITSGNNPGCRTNGFNATVGWDPVTGLGTPNYRKMADLFWLLQS